MILIIIVFVFSKRSRVGPADRRQSRKSIRFSPQTPHKSICAPFASYFRICIFLIVIFEYLYNYFVQHLAILIAGSPSERPLSHLRSPSTLLSCSSSLWNIFKDSHLCLGSDDHSRGEPSTSNLYHRERSFSVFLLLYIIILYYTEIFFLKISFSFYLLLRILLPSRETKWHLGILSQASALLGDVCIWACICTFSELLFLAWFCFYLL